MAPFGLALIGYVVGMMVWGIRLEGKVFALSRRQDDAAERLSAHYATKQELAQIEGKLAALDVAVSNVGQGVDRLERKIDTFMAAKFAEGATTSNHSH